MATIEKKGIDTAQKEIKEINQPEGTQNHVRLQKTTTELRKKSNDEAAFVRAGLAPALGEVSTAPSTKHL